MGRNQSFESSVVVKAARDLFWDKGYDAVSVSYLEEATGLNRSSLYHAFGSKRGVFDAAVTDYLDTVIRPRLRVLTVGTVGHTGLIAYFDELRAAVSAVPDDSPRRGCLLVNCAAGLAGHDEAARSVVDAYLAELITALQHALRNARDDDPDPAEVDEHARILASLSTTAMLLARVNRGESVALLTSACQHVREWAGASRR